MLTRKSLTTAVEILLCCLPFILIALVVGNYAVNVPRADDWALVPLLEKDRSGQISAGDLWQQHNEHRLVLPKFVMLLIARWTMWDIRYQMVVSLVCALISYVAVLRLLRGSLGSLPRGAMVTPLLVSSLLMFSPVRGHDWVWGWQIQWFMTVMALLVAVAILELWPEDRPAWQAVVLAGAATLFGLYSLSSGALIWGAGLVVLLMRPRYRRFVIAWLAAAVASTGTYLIGYVTPAHHPPIAYAMEHPWETLKYVAYYLGRPLTESEVIGVGAGVVLFGAFAALVAYIFTFRKTHVMGVAGWIGIGCYALGSALVTAVGRVGFGISQAGAARYTHISVLFLLAVLVLATIAISQGTRPGYGSKQIVPVILLWVAVGSAFVLNYPEQVRDIAANHSRMVEGQECILTVTSPDDTCLNIVSSHPQGAYVRTQLLKQHGWGPFATVAGRGE